MSSLAWHSIQAPARSQHHHTPSAISVSAKFIIDGPKLYYDIHDHIKGSVEITYSPHRTHNSRSKSKHPSFIKFSKLDLFFQGQEIIHFNGVYNNHNLKRKFINIRQIFPPSELAQFDIIKNENITPESAKTEYVLLEGKTYNLGFKFRVPPFLDSLSCKSQANLHLGLPPSTNQLTSLPTDSDSDSFQPIKIHYRLCLIFNDLTGREMLHRNSKLINVLPVSYHGITTLPNLKRYSSNDFNTSSRKPLQKTLHHNSCKEATKFSNNNIYQGEGTINSDVMYRFDLDPLSITPVVTTNAEVTSVYISSQSKDITDKASMVSYSYRLGFLYGKTKKPSAPTVSDVTPGENKILGKLYLQLSADHELWFDYDSSTSASSNSLKDGTPNLNYQTLPLSLAYTKASSTSVLPVITRVRSTIDSLTSVSVHHNNNNNDIYYYEKNDQYILPFYPNGAPAVASGQAAPTSPEIKVMKQKIDLGESFVTESTPWKEIIEGTNNYIQRIEVPIELKAPSSKSTNLLSSLIPSYQACYSSRVYVLNIDVFYTIDIGGQNNLTERCIKLKVPINIIALSQWKLKMFIENASKTLDGRHRQQMEADVPPGYDTLIISTSTTNTINTPITAVTTAATTGVNTPNGLSNPQTAHDALFADLEYHDLGLAANNGENENAGNEDENGQTENYNDDLRQLPIYSTHPAVDEIDLSRLQLLRDQQRSLSSPSPSSTSLASLSESVPISFLATLSPRTSLSPYIPTMALSPTISPLLSPALSPVSSPQLIPIRSLSSSQLLSPPILHSLSQSQFGFRRGGGSSIDANLHNIMQYLSPPSSPRLSATIVDETSPP
ncbi:hypothetical protein NADFUDRAFT_44260 [Nadsonia fulvescens var. elongata DSM 6958]|uniref:Uncharacterized protein n=1 Tax=Nadsonia fulvescens var. elongata DSM 6958 TaxID=857566 RepID=A0A1E3PDA2_9ASCO|nr:hypothetical protein NADFUDRAFT_44260 [Nadsonia fulvescens var. elongata DSM 6958]